METGGAVSEMQQGSYQEPWERRRCEHTLTGGTRCRRWADREERLCHAHRMYAETWGRSRVDVPLLEDEASILYVLSQTAQALARAAMPPAVMVRVLSLPRPVRPSGLIHRRCVRRWRIGCRTTWCRLRLWCWMLCR